MSHWGCRSGRPVTYRARCRALDVYRTNTEDHLRVVSMTASTHVHRISISAWVELLRLWLRSGAWAFMVGLDTRAGHGSHGAWWGRRTSACAVLSIYVRTSDQCDPVCVSVSFFVIDIV